MLKNSLYSILSRILVAVSKIVSYIFIAKHLSVEEYGKFNFAITLTTILSLIFLMGYQHSIITVNSRERKNDCFLSTTRLYTLVLSFMAFILVTIISFLCLNNTSIQLSSLYGFVVLTQILYTVELSILISKNQFKQFMFFNLFQSILFLLFVLSIKSTDYYIYLLLFGTSNLVAVKDIFKVKDLKVLSFKRGKRIIKIQWAIGYKNFLFEINNIFHYRFDTVLLGLMGNHYYLGLYSVVKNVIEGILYLPKALQPILMREATVSKVNDTKNLKKVLIVFSVLYAFILIVFIFFGELIIRLTFGDNYTIVIKPLLIAIFGIYFYSVSILVNSYLLGKRKFNHSIKNAFVTSLMFIIFNIILIPIINIYGAALTIVLGSIVYLLLTLTILKKNKVMV